MAATPFGLRYRAGQALILDHHFQRPLGVDYTDTAELNGRNPTGQCSRSHGT